MAVTLMFNDGVKFTHKSYAKHFDVSLTTSKRDLQILVENKIISKYTVKGAKTFSINGL